MVVNSGTFLKIQNEISSISAMKFLSSLASKSEFVILNLGSIIFEYRYIKSKKMEIPLVKSFVLNLHFFDLFNHLKGRFKVLMYKNLFL